MGVCLTKPTDGSDSREVADKGPLRASLSREASFPPSSIPSSRPELQVQRPPSWRTTEEASFKPNWSTRKSFRERPTVGSQPSWRTTTDVEASSHPNGSVGQSFRERSAMERRPSWRTTTVVEASSHPNGSIRQSFRERPAIERQPSSVRRSSNASDRRSLLNKKYSYIPDNYTSLDQVTAALREAGLESSNLIVGVDFTKSNEWTGKRSFNGQSLHKIGDRPNPYEKAISVIGKVLAPFDEDNLIPCFGFGDSLTHDTEVFSFHTDRSPCHGFEEVLACYRKIVSHLRLAGPTSFAPIVEAAVDIVERSHGQYHVLLIIADGQVTRSVDTDDGDLSPQERNTINAIVMASAYPLSIVLVGVGDGPWEDMKKFDDRIPAREFDNFQFVNFTAIMEKQTSAAEKEAAFALAALMEVPLQYKATMELGILGHVTGKAKQVVPRPPPLPAPQRLRSLSRSRTQGGGGDDPNQACPVCLSNPKDMAFGCGHMTCRECSSNLTRCPICRTVITSRLRIYAG